MMQIQYYTPWKQVEDQQNFAKKNLTDKLMKDPSYQDGH